jgi:hypothetical protein
MKQPAQPLPPAPVPGGSPVSVPIAQSAEYERVHRLVLLHGQHNLNVFPPVFAVRQVGPEGGQDDEYLDFAQNWRGIKYHPVASAATFTSLKSSTSITCLTFVSKACVPVRLFARVKRDVTS